MKDQYRPKRVMDLPGRKAVSVYDFDTKHLHIPAGTVFTAERSALWSKVHAVGPVCSCCGVAPRVTCDVGDLRFLDPADALPLPTTSIEEDRLAALKLVRMSNGWRYLADETRALIDAAIAGVKP